MVNILLAFVTGLTTGGLSCLAVQGGLLASSLTGQIEKDLQNTVRKTSRRNKRAQKQSGFAAPILVFLIAKLLAYTALGFLLGLLGQMFQLTPVMRALLLVAVGIFMLGSALRMLNVHPIFRYFVIEPPAFIRRRLRKTAANSGSSLAAPVFLGLLTVLIPCGITQAMLAAAITTASPLQGAALMAAFTLGTSPVFFAVAYFATQLGKRLEKYFMRFAAFVVLVLGLISIDSGITLAGSPISVTRLVNRAFPQAVEASAGQTAQGLQAYQPLFSEPAEASGPGSVVGMNENVITVNVLNQGYDPQVVHAKAGAPLKLRLVSQDVYSCSLAFVIPSLNIERYLKVSGEEIIEIPAQQKGTRMPFSCSMGMYVGEIIFDL